ncbi:MAG TPA: preprotein translocase subunit SecG [Syntrophales bacterium]|nr:preprotein translocase subunit SecG [Syntrophales bacterium]HPX11481.1 preprotein translocase subunit SecG [Syntrophales bacterium]HQB31406.1 preprotein translocase subunit SecG [Syntrophales bacterium]HQN78854.1 preprotein translocase subunit SecG [Syntrophales bacterium]HQQ27979.1 preprotein translocase subunit SecG [Syntrophales bacterium]
MFILVTVIHVIICFLLIMIVLLQSGRGADMGAAFGGSSQTIFGSSGPTTFLGKMTTVIATVFMLTSLWLAYFAVHKAPSVMDGVSVPPAVEQTLPAQAGSTQEGAAPAATPAQPAAPPAGTGGTTGEAK